MNKVSTLTVKPFGVIYSKEKGRQECSFKEIASIDIILGVNSSRELTLHREDGPAIEFHNGGKEWFLNGLRHREDGPAMEWEGDQREWFIYGKRHRIDGPAIEYSKLRADLNDKEYNDNLIDYDNDASNYSWYIDDVSCSQLEHSLIMQEVKNMSLAERLTDPRWWVRELK